MIEGLKPYPKMKDSGVPWLGRVPEHWTLRRMKTVLHERVEKGFPEEPLLAATQTKGVVRKERYETRTVVAMKDLHLLKLVRPGDFVISLRSFQGGIEYAREQGIISPAYTILESRDADSHGYLARLFKSSRYIENLSLFVTGIRQGQNIDYEKLARDRIPIPSSSEQAAIARFLTRADRRIRRFIRSKQKLGTLLEEQKQAIIHRAVTRGLDSSIRLKPSGQEWTGDIPSHWDLFPNRAFLRLRKEIVGARSEDYVLLSLTKRGIIARDMENPEGKFPTSFDTYQVIEPGDLVFCLFDIDETPRAVGLSSLHGMITGAYTRFACDPSIADWVYLFYLAMDNGKRLKPLYTGLRKVITKSRFLGAKIPVPPPDERSRLIAEVAHATQGATEAIARAQREIDLLKEFRTRLISDVVTGKLDVREAAARLPEESIDGDDPFDDTDPDGEEDDDSAAESGLEDGDGG